MEHIKTVKILVIKTNNLFFKAEKEKHDGTFSVRTHWMSTSLQDVIL